MAEKTTYNTDTAVRQIMRTLADLINDQKVKQVDSKNPAQITITAKEEHGGIFIFQSATDARHVTATLEEMYFAMGRLSAISEDCYDAEFRHQTSDDGRTITIEQLPEKVGSHMLIRL